MRTLFTTGGGTGHFHPLVPIARAMAGAGHEVAFATFAYNALQVEASGFRCFRARGSSEDEREAVQLELRGLSPAAHREFLVRRGFPVLNAQRMLPDILALHAQWPPDLVVSDNCEFAGRVAGECWNIPHATVKSGNNYRYNERHALVPAMDALRAMAGLPPDPDAAMVYRYLYLLNEPPHFRSPTEVLPPTAVRLRRGAGGSRHAVGRAPRGAVCSTTGWVAPDLSPTR